jgi:non-ribosomal peptide synthetase-like protein
VTFLSHAGHVPGEHEAAYPSKESQVGRSVDIAVHYVDSSTVANGQVNGQVDTGDTGDTGESSTEAGYAGVLAELTGDGPVTAETHFFDDLGADSMVMARFCARVRKRADLPPVSMKDIYAHPTVRSLAAALDGAAPAEPGPVAPPEPAPVMADPVRTGQYVLCGASQLLFLLGYPFVAAVIVNAGYDWISAASGAAIYLRAVGFSVACVLGMVVAPVAAKWMLVGRWKSTEFRVWGLTYFRFWVVKTLIRANPLLLFIGGRSDTSASSPLYVLYLRALGAKIGKEVTIFSRIVPVCTDLLTIGDGTVIRKDALFPGYRADSGVIRTGPVTLGKNVFVGETSVLDIGTCMGDGAQLGHASALHTGQAVPEGEHWHGVPAERTGIDYLRVPSIGHTGRYRVLHGITQLLAIVTVYLPVALGAVAIFFGALPRFGGLLDEPAVSLTHWSFYLWALAVSAIVFTGAILGTLLLMGTVPRLLNLAMEPGKVYRLYGFHYWVHRAIARLTNIRFFVLLFGDSSYVVHFLRWIGYDLTQIEQTGSNFGGALKHETPFHVSVGTGTMVADGLSVMNAEFSNDSFRLAPAVIGPRSFLGNLIAFPAGARTGDNCLLATKVLVPLDGETSHGAGLLGSPSFRIPRSVERDSSFDHLRRGEALRLSLRAKNRYNLRSMAVLLLVRWGYLFGFVLLTLAAAGIPQAGTLAAIAGESVLAMLFTVGHFVLAERTVAGFRAMRPRFCSIYHPYFWWQERFWKCNNPDVGVIFAGTPVKNLISRALGMRVGRQVFDDGCGVPEKTLTAVSDRAMLNAGAVIQCHSQEDGTYKSDRTRIGANCTLSVGSFVHYGVSVGDGAMIEAGSFLMKGEEVPSHERWSGNPARKT